MSLVVLIATVPFLGKAFHIDDPLYLAVARQILAKPWDPYAAEVLWERVPEPLFDADFNPPLWSYCLAGVMAFTGEPTVKIEQAGTTAQGTPTFHAESSRLPEVSMHMLESMFVGAAAVALYLLGRRWVRWPLTATALVVLSPAMLPGQNVMLEGPVMAFWLWGVWCHIRAIETNKLRWSWCSGALAALGLLTKYTSGLVLVVLALYSVRRRHGRSLWFLAAPVAALSLWSLHNWIVYERLHAFVIFSRVQTGQRAPVGVTLFETWGRFLAVFRAVGAVTMLTLPVVGILGRRFGTWVVLLLVTGSLGIGWVGKQDVVSRLVERDGRDANKVLPKLAGPHLIVFGALGSLTLLGLIVGSWRNKNAVRATESSGQSASDVGFLLWLWLVSVLVFGVFATPFLAVRHLLPAVPPLVWLVLRRLDETMGNAHRAIRWLLVPATLLSTTIGFLIAKADYDFAEWYRHMAVDVASRTVAAGKTREKNVWYTGHWGWAYYADRVGMKPFISGRSRMDLGDFLLMPLAQTWELPPKELNPFLKGLMRPIKPTPPSMVRTGVAAVDRIANWCLSSVRSLSNEVNLYGSGTYTIPWQFSRRPLDDFGVIEVRTMPDEIHGATDPWTDRPSR